MTTHPSSPSSHHSPPRVAVVGGGLAGLAAAAALCEQGVDVELFEARRRLGGRAGSYLDPARNEWVDHCQHVGMACCTNLADFCRRTDIARWFRRDKVLHFFGPDGKRYDLQAARWLPVPLHLAPWLLRVGYLSWPERLGVARALMRLARTAVPDGPDQPGMGRWLREQGQSERAIERFWAVVLVSALGESVERASLAAARKVFLDGFLSARNAYQVDVPTLPLDELYGQRVVQWLRGRGVQLHLGHAVSQLEGTGSQVTGLIDKHGTRRQFDYYVLAVPWRRVRSVLSPQLDAALPELIAVERFESAPITGVHLWFDRPITPLPHAVLIERLSQWVFNRGERRGPAGTDAAAEPVDRPAAADPFGGHHYQVVISASRQLAGRDREDILREVLGDLQATWPQAAQARLLHWRIVTQQHAVFSVRPGLDPLRPAQQTPVANLMLAGDWTATGWPSTMEGAVRSGYLAAEAILQTLGRPTRLLVPDLASGWRVPGCGLRRVAGAESSKPQ